MNHIIHQIYLHGQCWSMCENISVISTIYTLNMHNYDASILLSGLWRGNMHLPGMTIFVFCLKEKINLYRVNINLCVMICYIHISWYTLYTEIKRFMSCNSFIINALSVFFSDLITKLKIHHMSLYTSCRKITW